MLGYLELNFSALDARVVTWSDRCLPPMDRDPPANPYAPPGSEFNVGLVAAAQGAELAERGTRLAAASLDGLLVTVPLLPMLFLGIYLGFRGAMNSRGSPGAISALPSPAETPIIAIAIFAGLGFFAVLGVAIYQWMLISRTGQSLGKKWMGIRIEKVDGTRLTFGAGVVLRNWVPKVMGAVPYLGAIFHLVDCFYIFREDRRCLHDHIAGTRVVRNQR
jgi:uncharacterized RDD family membrane protein YckC